LGRRVVVGRGIKGEQLENLEEGRDVILATVRVAVSWIASLVI
jgi:hypothetical protein